MASIVSKGGWSSEEDRRLLDAVEKHGMKCVSSPSLFAELLIISVILGGLSLLRWWRPATAVVSHPIVCYVVRVPTVTPAECAKRWQDTLNPAIDRR